MSVAEQSKFASFQTKSLQRVKGIHIKKYLPEIYFLVLWLSLKQTRKSQIYINDTYMYCMQLLTCVCVYIFYWSSKKTPKKAMNALPSLSDN